MLFQYYICIKITFAKKTQQERISFKLIWKKYKVRKKFQHKKQKMNFTHTQFNSIGTNEGNKKMNEMEKTAIKNSKYLVKTN